MSTDIDKALGRITQLAKADRYEEAVDLARQSLLDAGERRDEVLAKLAYVKAREGDYQQALSDITEAIASNSREPDYFYTRARYLLALRNAKDALSDLERVIQLCDEYDSDYYRHPAHFLKAKALAMMGQPNEALVELSRVPDDFSTWMDGPKSKQQLVEECKSRIRD